MTKSVNKPIDAAIKASPQALFQGAFISADGKEIPITEEMILEACSHLEGEASTFYPRTRRSGKPQ